METLRTKADFQVQSERAIRRHWALACCALACCQWIEGQRLADTGSPRRGALGRSRPRFTLHRARQWWV